MKTQKATRNKKQFHLSRRYSNMFSRISSIFIISIMLIGLGGVYQANAVEPRWVVVERLAVGECVSPEDVVFDAEGRLYAGMADGRIMRFQSDGAQPEVFADTGESRRPLGLKFDESGNLLACAGQLLSIAPDGSITVLSPEEVDGIPIQVANNVDTGADGTIYFSNCTTSQEQIAVEVFQGQPAPNGHLFAYDPKTKTTRMLLDGLWFANGVAVSVDQSFVLVAESTKFRVTRYWLTGPKQGESDIFIELPGMPDNITSNGKDMFWVASPYGFVLGLDMDGNIVHHLNLLYPSGEPYTYNTGVIEHKGMLYMGHIRDNAIGRVSYGITSSGPEDFTNVFFMNLTAGLNMISLPLNPITPYTARSFAGRFSATMMIKLDEARQKFVGFTNDAPDDGFDIEGGKGYIVNVPEAKMVTFVGAAWTNQPPVAAAPEVRDFGYPAQTDGAWAFVVSGKLDVEHVANLFHVTVRNTRTNAVATDVVRKGYFAAAFADLTRKNVVQTGDRLEVTVKDGAGEIASETFTYTVTPETIRQAFMPITLKNIEKPRHSLLLQNYPNPFNPETWIPYQIRESAEVVIRIYNVQGRLVRTLDLGQRAAGFYLGRTKAAYWDGKNKAGEKVASGVYFYQIKTGDFTATRRMVIVK